MRSWAPCFIAVLVAGLAACGGGDGGPDPIVGGGNPLGLLGEAAPDFTLASSSGEHVRLADQRGSVVMLHFWASWCGPCRPSMPLVDAMHQRYGSAGLMVWGVDVEEDNTDAKKLIKDLGVTFPVLYDTESQAASLYRVDALPTTVLIDKKGKVRHVHRGYKPGDENVYRSQIRELIRE